MKLADATQLTDWFESSESMTEAGRKRMDRCVDYYNGNQLADEEKKALKDRGQPIIIDNKVKGSIDFLIGVEKGQRVDPKARPRTPNDGEAALVANEALNFVKDDVSYDTARSEIWKGLLKSGLSAIKVGVREDRYGITPDTEVISYDRCFYDPHSAKPNFDDARYKGTVTWFDLDVAVEMYGEEHEDILTAAMASESGNQHYDDKPKWAVWGDAKRQRVRVCEIYYKWKGVWCEAVFTKGGAIINRPSPYIDEEGNPECPLILQSAYVDRDNNRYGPIQEKIDLQDDYNKRRSKATHILNSRQVIADKGAVDDPQQARHDLAQPDAWIEKNPGTDIDINGNTGLEVGQFQLMQMSAASLESNDIKSSMIGGESQSGRAKQAQQQAAFIELGDLLDYLRDVDTRIFKMWWNRIKQFWDSERWVLVTDDDNAPQHIGLNVPLTDPYGRVVGLQNPVAEMNVDIIIEDAPDVTSLQAEENERWMASLPTFAQLGVPPAVLLEITLGTMEHSRSKNKLEKVIEKMKQPQQQPPPDPIQQEMARLTVADKAADVDKKQMDTKKTESEIMRNMADARSKVPERVPVPIPVPVAANQGF